VGLLSIQSFEVVMASVTYNCTKDASVHEAYGWAGYCDHLPTGMGGSGWKYKCFLYFPINFTGMTGITSATLKLYGHRDVTEPYTNHSISNSSVADRGFNARRMTSDWGEGTDRGETFSSNESWNWSNRATAYTSTGEGSLTVATFTDGAAYNVDVTNVVKAWAPVSAGGSGSANYGFCLHNWDMTVESKGLEFWSRHATSGLRPTLTINYTTNTAPLAPSGLTPTGLTTVHSLTPTFAGTFEDNEKASGDSMTKYQIQMGTDNTFATNIWDTTITTAVGTLSFSKQYDGATTLVTGTTYYWRARCYDESSATGAWSAAQSFKVNQRPPTPSGLSPSEGSTVSTLTPTFSGVSSDADFGDQLTAAQIWVYRASDSRLEWDSGEFATSGATFSKAFNSGGTLYNALVQATQYYWTCQVKDNNGGYNATNPIVNFSTYAVGSPTGTQTRNTTGGTATARVNTLTPWFVATLPTAAGNYSPNVYLKIYTSTGALHATQNVSISNGATSVNVQYSNTALAWSTKYKWTVEYRDSAGNWSVPSAQQDFWTNSPPVATQTSPANGIVVTTLTPAFTSTFSDADKSNGFDDAPSSYVVEVSLLNSPYTVMHTLTKSSSLSSTSNSVTRAAEGTALSLNTWYRWRAYYVDNTGASNATGSYSGYFSFKPSAVPTISSFVVQASDLTTGSINRPTPTLTYTFTGSGGKTQLTRKIRILDAANADSELYSTGFVTDSTTSWQVPLGYIQQGGSYKFELTTTDTDNLQSAVTTTTAYGAAWTPPATLDNFSVTADDTKGYVRLDWDDSTDVDFMKYVVYRKAPMDADFTQYATIEDKTHSYFIDYDTSFNQNYTYKVSQWKTVAGSSPVESVQTDPVVGNISAEDWFLVVQDRDDLTFSFPVEDESHSAPFQEEVFEPFGRDRKVVVRSGLLGTEGSITGYFIVEEREDKLARLRAILADSTLTVYLKNPFGDYHKVFVDAPSMSYMTGGALRFSLRYIEVD
jgi:hypothetical protein